MQAPTRAKRDKTRSRSRSNDKSGPTYRSSSRRLDFIDIDIDMTLSALLTLTLTLTPPQRTATLVRAELTI